MLRNSIARLSLATALVATALLVPGVAFAAQETTTDPATAAAEQARQQAESSLPLQPPSELVVTEYVVRRSSTGGSVHVAGIIENRSAASLGVKTIAVSLFGPDGATVGAGTAMFGQPTMLEPGMSSGWVAPISNVPDLPGLTVRVQVESGPAQRPYLAPISHDLRVDGLTIQPRRAGALPTVAGQVVNTGTETLSRPRVLLALYGPDGKLVDVEESVSALDSLAPGQSAPFSKMLIGFPLDAPSEARPYVEATLKR